MFKDNLPLELHYPIEYLKMKKYLIFLIPSLLLISCQKDSSLKDSEIPGWLKERIALDEAVILANPASGLDCAAWIRYDSSGDHFYVYFNMLLSSWPPVYDSDGTQLSFMDDGGFDDKAYKKFRNSLCCKKYVWKGEKYYEL